MASRTWINSSSVNQKWKWSFFISGPFQVFRAYIFFLGDLSSKSKTEPLMFLILKRYQEAMYNKYISTVSVQTLQNK